MTTLYMNAVMDTVTTVIDEKFRIYAELQAYSTDTFEP